MYSIEIKNFDEVVKAFERAPLVVDGALQNGVKKAGAKILELEKSEAPVGKSGQLRRNIEFEYRPISAMVYPKMDYAAFVNFGTGLYGPKNSLIFPKRARALRWKSGGGYVFAKYTRGMKANPFVKRTVNQAQGPINSIFNNILREIKI